MVVCLIDTPYTSSVQLPITPFTSTVVVHKIVSVNHSTVYEIE